MSASTEQQLPSAPQERHLTSNGASKQREAKPPKKLTAAEKKAAAAKQAAAEKRAANKVAREARLVAQAALVPGQQPTPAASSTFLTAHAGAAAVPIAFFDAQTIFMKSLLATCPAPSQQQCDVWLASIKSGFDTIRMQGAAQAD